MIMINPINSNEPQPMVNDQIGASRNIGSTQDQSTKTQFMAIFYKELLKQAFKAPNFSYAQDEQPSFGKSYVSDLFLDKMALQLAQKQKKEGSKEERNHKKYFVRAVR